MTAVRVANVGEQSRNEVETVVRETRWLVSWIDPAKLRADGPTFFLAERSEVLEEYVTPSLAVARALLAGATTDEAVSLLCHEMEERGFTVSARRARKLARHLRRSRCNVKE